MPHYRHELKYEISYSEFLLLKSRLNPVMEKDPHADSLGGYHITSLYFDNFNDKALFEKLDGVPIRDKYRIRYYNDDFSQILMEKKSKHQNLCLKKSCRISQDECRSILNGNVDWCVQDKERPVLQDFYRSYTGGVLRPKTIVSYDRIPYIYSAGNVRVTFDYNIRSCLYHTDLFDQELPTLPVFPTGRMILEVKYDEFLPELIRILLQSGIPRLGAFSKYASCRQYE